jgi:hypothetical protein
MAYKQPYWPFAWMNFQYARMPAAMLTPSAKAAATLLTYETNSAYGSKHCDIARHEPKVQGLGGSGRLWPVFEFA